MDPMYMSQSAGSLPLPDIGMFEIREWRGHKYRALTDAGREHAMSSLLAAGIYGILPVSDVSYRGTPLKKAGLVVQKSVPGAQDIGDWLPKQISKGEGIVIAIGDVQLSGKESVQLNALFVTTKSVLVAETLAPPENKNSIVLIEPAGGWTEEAEEAGSSVLLYVGLGVAAVAGLYLVTRK